MAPPVNEDEARQLLYHYQELEQAVGVAREQMAAIQKNIMAGESTIRTIEALDQTSHVDSTESIVPIGSGCFVHAEIKDVSKVVIHIGSGANVEKSTNDAVSYLKNRNDRFREMLEDMNKSLTTILQKMQEIEKKLGSIQS